MKMSEEHQTNQPLESTDAQTGAETDTEFDNEYVLGTNEAEMHRLGFQHRLWSGAAHDLWQRAQIAPGCRVLDVGCGPGFASLDLAQIVTHTGQVVGVDESKPYIDFATNQASTRQLPHASFYQGDVGTIDELLGANGIEEGSFDIAYVRWVMCFVSEPDKVIQSIAKMLKPGGRLCIQDYMCYQSMSLAPKSDAFDRVISAIDKSWRDHGGDPDIMARIPKLSMDAGLTVREISRVEPRTPRPGSTMWNWPATFWPVFLPRLESLGYITPQEHQAFLHDWQERSNDPSAFMHLPPVYEMIATK
jgi:SAM-dependent methyltransferase